MVTGSVTMKCGTFCQDKSFKTMVSHGSKSPKTGVTVRRKLISHSAIYTGYMYLLFAFIGNEIH